MKIERDERRFDFHDIGLAIKRAREASGMTQEQLAYIVDRAPRTIMYNENDGQHPSLNTFYQMVTMFDISVDQYFYPSKNKGSECRKRIDAMLNALDEKELKIVEATGKQCLRGHKGPDAACWGLPQTHIFGPTWPEVFASLCSLFLYPQRSFSCFLPGSV